jgi:hypothetical protein
MWRKHGSVRVFKDTKVCLGHAALPQKRQLVWAFFRGGLELDFATVMVYN